MTAEDLRPIWYLDHPLWQYVEDVNAIAVTNGWRIVESRYNTGGGVTGPPVTVDPAYTASLANPDPMIGVGDIPSGAVGDGNPDMLPTITSRTVSTRGELPTATETNNATLKADDRVLVKLPDGTNEIYEHNGTTWALVDTDDPASGAPVETWPKNEGDLFLTAAEIESGKITRRFVTTVNGPANVVIEEGVDRSEPRGLAISSDGINPLSIYVRSALGSIGDAPVEVIYPLIQNPLTNGAEINLGDYFTVVVPAGGATDSIGQALTAGETVHVTADTDIAAIADITTITAAFFTDVTANLDGGVTLPEGGIVWIWTSGAHYQVTAVADAATGDTAEDVTIEWQAARQTAGLYVHGSTVTTDFAGNGTFDLWKYNAAADKAEADLGERVDPTAIFSLGDQGTGAGLGLWERRSLASQRILVAAYFDTDWDTTLDYILANKYVDGAYLEFPTDVISISSVKYFDKKDTFINFNGATIQGSGISLANANVNIRDLTIDSSNTFGLMITNGGGGSAKNIYIKNCKGVGLSMGGRQHSQIGWGAYENIVSIDNEGGGVSYSVANTGIPSVPFTTGQDPTSIVSGGSGYTDGTHSVLLTGGSGELATAVVDVTAGSVVEVRVQHGGDGYVIGDILSIASPDHNAGTTIGAGTGAQISVDTLNKFSGTGTKNWCNACIFKSLSIRRCSAFVMRASGGVGYNEFISTQVEGNTPHGDMIEMGGSLNKWFGGQFVSTIENANDKIFSTYGTGQNNKFIGTRFGHGGYAGTPVECLSAGVGGTSFFDCDYAIAGETNPHFTYLSSAYPIEYAKVEKLDVDRLYVLDGYNNVHSSRVTYVAPAGSIVGHAININISGVPSVSQSIGLSIKAYLTRNYSGSNNQISISETRVYINRSAAGVQHIESASVVDINVSNMIATVAGDVVTLTFDTTAQRFASTIHCEYMASGGADITGPV